MSSLSKQLETKGYLTALSATESIEAPAVGFAKPSEPKTPFEGQKLLIKQNNTIIALLVNLQQQLQEAQEDIAIIKRVQAHIKEQPATSKELEGSIEELTKRIGGLNLGANPIIPKKKGVIRVYKNPSDILRQEKGK